MSIPKLERICGSWVIVSRATNKSVCETFSQRFAEAINQEKFIVLTALQYLGELNRSIKTRCEPDFASLERKAP